MGDVYDWELEQKTANTISVGAIPEEMLKGYRTKPQGQGEPRRHHIVGEPFETRNPYHKDGTIAFADVFEQPDRVNIGYVSTAPEHRGQGHASALMQHVYDSYPDKRIVWGQRMDDAAEHMYQKYRKTMPDRTARTAAPDLATNWVYFRHKGWPEARLVSGQQPHHVLIHKVHDGELDGEEIINNLSNTWAAANGSAKGLEHDVARGVYDKKGKPQIWESNCDRNLVYDKALEKYEYAIPRTAARAEADTYALLSRQSGDDSPWSIDSTHPTLEEAYAAQDNVAQRVVMFPRGEEVHPHGDYKRISKTPQLSDAQHEARGYTKSAEEMYAEIQGKGWDVERQGPKGTGFSVTISNPQGSRVERQGNTQEQALASALTWVWQHSHMSKTANEPAGRFQIFNADGEVVNDSAPDAETCIFWAKDMAVGSEPGGWNSFHAYDAETKTDLGSFKPDEDGGGDPNAVYPGDWKTWSSSVKLPIEPRTTLGQVFSKLRPNPEDGNHLGLQAHALKYTRDELQTFLEAQEADGPPRGWRVFKDAAYTAYASRGWRVQAALTLEVYPLEGDLIRSKVQDQDVEQIKKQYSAQFNNGEIHRARLVDQMTGRTAWDTDEEWGTNKDWVPQRGNKWQQGQIIPVEQDWAFSTTGSEETNPDFTFVYYQGALEMEEWSANSRPADMLRRILDLGGKDITDQNVDDNNMASGNVFKRDGEIDVELTNLADEDVQTKALDSVQQWAQGMNLIGPIQPRG